MHFFSGDSQFAKSNQVLYLSWNSSKLQIQVFSAMNPLIYYYYFSRGAFSGGFEEYINYFCKVKPGCKICARNEWDIGSSILCVKKWPRWGKCSEYMLLIFSLFVIWSIIGLHYQTPDSLLFSLFVIHALLTPLDIVCWF